MVSLRLVVKRIWTSRNAKGYICAFGANIGLESTRYPLASTALSERRDGSEAHGQVQGFLLLPECPGTLPR